MKFIALDAEHLIVLLTGACIIAPDLDIIAKLLGMTICAVGLALITRREP